MEQDWTGELQLELNKKGKKTIAKDVFFQGAFKVMRPIYLDNTGQLTYYLLNPGGGYLSGDQYYMDIILNEDARATLTTQSATKVYKTPGNYAYQYSRFSLKAGSLLEYVPDPLIVYRDGTYKQHNQFYMDSSASLICTDIITPGWSPSGEQFSYDKVDLHNEFFVDGVIKIIDRIVIEPNKTNISTFGQMEGFSHLGSMMMVSPLITDELIEDIHDLIAPKEVNFGISKCPVTGFSLRILANQTQVIEEVFQKCQDYVRKVGFDAPPVFLRKY